jgi:hypothetical protein
VDGEPVKSRYLMMWPAPRRIGLSPITTVGRFGSVDAAQVATDEVWAAT